MSLAIVVTPHPMAGLVASNPDPFEMDPPGGARLCFPDMHVFHQSQILPELSRYAIDLPKQERLTPALVKKNIQTGMFHPQAARSRSVSGCVGLFQPRAT